MSPAVSAQHPAVVLRSSYRLVQALLAIAAMAVVGLTVAVVFLAINSGGCTTASAVGHPVPKPISNRFFLRADLLQKGSPQS
jgi:hypothetical protein